MKIRSTAFLGMASVMVSLCIGLPLLSFYSFARIERQELRDHVHLAENILKEEILQLATTATDYSAWDQTYRFVRDRNREYVANELGKTFYTKLRLSLFAIVDNDGRPVFVRAHDFLNDKIMPLPASLQQHIARGSLLLDQGMPEHRRAGLLSFPEGLMIVASRPILTSEYQGPPRGTLVVGRFLYDSEVRRIAKTSQLEISLIKAGTFPDGVPREVWNSPANREKVLIREESNDSISGYALLRDVYGKDAGLLKIGKTRELYRQAKRSTVVFIAVCGTLLALLMGYFIASRRRVETARRLEQLSNERFHSLIEHGVDAIFLFDDTGNILVSNHRACEITGYSAAEVGRMNIAEIFGQEGSGTPAFDYDRLRQGETVAAELRLSRHDETPLYVEIHSRIMPEGNFQCSVRDITGRKLLEQELLEQRNAISEMAAELSIAEDRERGRIAGELHDQVGPNLLLAKMKLDGLASRSASGESDQSLAVIGDLIDRSVQDIRSLTFQMRPPILANAGLEAALKWLVQEFAENYRLRVEILDSAEPKPLSYEVRSVLFQAIRELLLNVVKHAGTDHALIRLSGDVGSVVVVVEDRGAGFDLGRSGVMQPKSGGFGIFNAQKRIEHLGGILEVETMPGTGTRVTLRAPLDVKGETTYEHSCRR